MSEEFFSGEIKSFNLEGEDDQSRELKVVHSDGVIEIRDMVVESARNFKTSWVQLGQVLYSVWRDKLYCDWGFESFEVYVGKEVGLQKKTAVKLLRNYFFLEKEEPKYVQKDTIEATQPAAVPNQDAVNVLRLAKARKELDRNDFQKLKTDAFENFKDANLLKKDLTAYIKQAEQVSPEEARRKERMKMLKKYVASLKNLKRDAELLKIVPEECLETTNKLIKQMESQLETEAQDFASPKAEPSFENPQEAQENTPFELSAEEQSEVSQTNEFDGQFDESSDTASEFDTEF